MVVSICLHQGLERPDESDPRNLYSVRVQLNLVRSSLGQHAFREQANRYHVPAHQHLLHCDRLVGDEWITITVIL